MKQFRGLMSLIVFESYHLDSFSVGATLFNHIDLSRILIVLKLDISALLGYTCAVFQKFIGTGFGLIISISTLSLWVILPVLNIYRKCIKKDF